MSYIEKLTLIRENCCIRMANLIYEKNNSSNHSNHSQNHQGNFDIEIGNQNNSQGYSNSAGNNFIHSNFSGFSGNN